MAASVNKGAANVRVTGLGALARNLKAVEADFPKKVKRINGLISEDVAVKAKARALGLGSVAAHTIHEGGLRAGQSARTAYVFLGGTSAPFAAGAEFGSSVYRQFDAWKGNGPDAGYFLFPTIRDEKETIEKIAHEEIEDLLNNFVKDNGGD